MDSSTKAYAKTACIVCGSPNASGNPKLCDICWELNQRFAAVKWYNREAAVRWLKDKLVELGG
jgi:hypothetical protein